MLFRLAIALGFALTSSLANGAERLAVSTPAAGISTKVAAGSGQDGWLRLAQHHHHHYHPVFLGCVHDSHECYHRAHGFHHYFVRHDHDFCPRHPHEACFGYND